MAASGKQLRGEALDFAVTSGMRSDFIRKSMTDPGAILEHYEEFKRTYKETARECRQAGFRFTPMVMEAHAGAWSTTARQVLDRLSKNLAASSGEEPTLVSLRIAQRMSTTLHRENARAILKRLPSPVAEPMPSGWEEGHE